jgi:hypothetical protein
MDQRIPTLLCPLLQEYTHLVEREMPGRISAFYLEGSIALDEFNSRLSDIDFIAVMDTPVTSTDFEKLLAVHRRIEPKAP